MAEHLKDFFRRLQAGVEVAVAEPSSEHLLGVRDGFLRYFEHGIRHALPVSVRAETATATGGSLAQSEEEAIAVARSRALRLRDQFGDRYLFFVSSEVGLRSLEIDGQTRSFVQSWSVIVAAVGESWGSSGALQFPQRLVEASDASLDTLASLGTRRRGGLMSSLTAGQESRRTAVALSTFHGLAALLFGYLHSGETGNGARHPASFVLTG